MNSPSRKYPEILDDMAGKLAALLTEEGMTEARAQLIGFRFAESMRLDWGGANIYIPMGTAHDSEQMAREAYRRWNRKNTRELAREFGVSERRVRQLWDIGKALARQNGEPPSDVDDDPQDALL